MILPFICNYLIKFTDPYIETYKYVKKDIDKYTICDKCGTEVLKTLDYCPYCSRVLK